VRARPSGEKCGLEVRRYQQHHMKPTVFLLSCLLNTSTASAQLTVNCQGTGHPVYLIGGGPAFTTWNLEPIQQRLRAKYQVCRWDMRGVGENAGKRVKQDVPVLTQWLQDMANVLPAQPVVLWGHSWGALQALLFADHYPERVQALILNNPVDPELQSLKNIEAKRYVHPFVESHLKLEDIDTPAEKRHRFRSKIASYFLDARKGWAYSAQFDHGDSNNTLNVQIWQEYRQMPLEIRDLAQLSPKLSKLIYCEQDVLMPESFDQYSAVIPPEKHYTINNCAHFPWVESPVEFYQILLKALSDVY
ncbi:MAG: alpha/beta hydrolase, partial [Gammaproteobacteria bacterium]